MKIHFQSKYGINQIEKIDFKSNLNVAHTNGKIIWEFLEPSKNIQNRIEHTEKEVTIFAGPTTLVLFLNKKIKNVFNTEYGNIKLKTHLLEIVSNNKELKLHYELLDMNDVLLNKYWLDILIEE